MLLLLDLQDGPVTEIPPHDIGFRTGTFDIVCRLDCRPELVEFLELDKMPHFAQWCLNDGGFKD